MRFKKGQKIVCVKSGDWINITNGSSSLLGPAFNQIVTCFGYRPYLYNGYGLILTYEFPNTGFNEFFFEPLIEDSVLEKELQDIPQSVEV